ncbi:Fic family protein [Candidatus Roizmanbacteria bacterium]|nr:Fic family protein [Candidatus Roizmanbacteria bacterium]
MAKTSFSPPKLPPSINYEKLVADIARAHASISKLDVLLSQLKNPSLVARTLATREAVLSSQIEGTQATLSEVLEQEAMDSQKEDTAKEKDFREIINYRHALEQGVEKLKERPLTESLIKELHAILLRSARGHNRGPGEFRRKLVYIGKPGSTIDEATYVPPLPDAIPELFSDLEKYIHSDEREVLVQIGVVHYQFEAIHPFEDGNGRIGRLLISLMLYKKKLLSYPFIYLSEFFEEHRRDYYDLLNGVSEKDDWENWLVFFLRGLNIQAQKTQETCQDILNLHEELRSKALGLNSKYAHEFLDAIFVNPFFNSVAIRRLSGIKNTQTLFTLISKFKAAGIIEDVAFWKKRNKIYRFPALLEILNK